MQVAETATQITCAYCGSILTVEHKQDHIDLSVAKKLEEAFHDVGRGTQESIREGTGVTQAELQRLQIGQQISSLQIQLSNIRSEIRALEREKRLSRNAKHQLKELRQEERDCMLQINSLQAALAPNVSPTSISESGTAKKMKSSSPPSPMRKGCIWGCLTYLAVGVICGGLGMAFDSAFFEASTDSEGYGPVFSIGAIVAFIMGVVVFLRIVYPDASFWNRLPGPFKTEPAPVSGELEKNQEQS
ncbi:MAG TPA: hypothetical protein VFI27_05415 [candidate division Zixibacteria bacterium]|nr:hypothetical protein [candidate division Zixibacteria bacterium]